MKDRRRVLIKGQRKSQWNKDKCGVNGWCVRFRRGVSARWQHFGRLIVSDGEGVNWVTEMKQRDRRGVKVKGLIMNIINDEACGLHGPQLLIKWAQLHLRPTQDAWIHGAAWNCVFVANCYCYEVRLLADPLRWWIVLMKCPGFTGSRRAKSPGVGPSCSFVASLRMQSVMQGGANNSGRTKCWEAIMSRGPSFPQLCHAYLTKESTGLNLGTSDS